MVNEHPLIAYAPFLEPAQNEYVLQARDLVISSAKRLHEKISAHNNNNNNNVNINADVLIGLPTTILVQQAKEWPADLIVVGSHSRSGIEQLLLGSVSREIVAQSPCSVMVVKIGKHALSKPPCTEAQIDVSLSTG